MSNQINIMVSQIVDWYAKRQRDGMLTLNLNDVPEHDINNLCALMLSQDDDLAAESVGADNPEFFKAIIPAIFKIMVMPRGGFENEEFRDVMCSSIRAYLRPRIEAMIESKLEYVNEDNGCHTSLIWDHVHERAIEVGSTYRI